MNVHPIALKRRLLVPLVAIVAAAAACGKQQQSATPGAGGSAAAGTQMAPAGAAAIPAGVQSAATHGEDAYDMIAAGKWNEARAAIDSINATIASVPDTLRSGDASRAEIAAAIAAADSAIAMHDTARAATAANRITYLAARLSEPFAPKTPAAVALLDYYGRELELGARSNDAGRLSRTRTEIISTWRSLRPQVEARGGAVEAKRFDAIVARVEGARGVPAYRAAAKPLLDEVDALERVFAR